MYIVKLPNAAAHKLTVTGTATSLFSLITTAAGQDADLEGRLNAIMLNVEDGDIRVLFDGNNPTATEGLLLARGEKATFTGVPLSKMKLIRAGSADVTISVEVGLSDECEGFALSPGGGEVGVFNETPPTLEDGESSAPQLDQNGNLKVTEATLRAGEDISNDVQKVEHRFSYLLATADTLVKTGTGVLHSVTFTPNDATPTAGSIILYDNTAESGAQILNWNIAATAFVPITVVLDVEFLSGLYIGFTTTADVNVTLSYR